MKSLIKKSRILFFLPAVFSASAFAEKNIQEVIVTSDFREAQLKNIPSSISVINAEVISQRNSDHLEQILSLAPNVNFAAGASRGKYFQIRGIGERGQFDAPLNPSVGTYVDGIDFTGYGGAATLLDIDQVEILRGSQGTRFGANALAGVVSLKTVDPEAESQGYAKTSLSSYGGRKLETAFGGALNDQWLYRVAGGKTLSDGFINNTTLDRNDTNNIDELTSRLKLRYLAADNLTVDFTALHLDIDNGFDAFSLDENRDTLSNEPGNDRQDTKAFALNSNWTVSDALSINSIFTTNRSAVEYSYDYDWTGPDLQGWQVFESFVRDIARDSSEVRWISGPMGQFAESDWLVGIYHQISDINLTKLKTDDPIFTSLYKTSSASLFAQASTPLRYNLAITSGIRFEKWQSDYSDSNQINGKSNENLFGGKLAFELTTNEKNLMFLSLTRGYKAGGFNSEVNLPSEDYRQFETEYQWNYEVGAKLYSPSGTLSNNITAFYADRKDLQLNSSSPVDEDAEAWIGFVANAGKGYSYGIEWEMTWQPQDNLRIASSLGLLKTKITEHENKITEDDNDGPGAFNLKHREVAHAPEYSFATSVQYDLTKKLTATLEFEGKDKFYYSDSHNFQSQAYNLVNARLAYHANGYQLTAYINNATDKDYGVRGFFGWDADPREGEGFDEQSYQQLGAPKVIGLSLRTDF
jgi:iron complex outermembrane receptor protein